MKKIIIANWKMNPGTSKDAKKIFESIKKTALRLKNADVILAPSFAHLSIVRPSGPIKLAAQDVFYEDPPVGARAFTGEVSASMLKDLKVTHVIVGHSERRDKMGESQDIVNKKVKLTLSKGFRAVLCIGEKEKTNDGFPEIVKTQLYESLKGVSRNMASRAIIAYEPVWAIGTGKADDPENLFQMSIFIRRSILDIWGRQAAFKIQILYGGSVNSKNAKDFLDVKGISGLLVGGASLKPDEFNKILKLA